MRPERSRNQDQPTDQQNQHHHGVEQAGGLKINVHVGDDARENKQRSSDGQQPSDDALAVPEQNPDAEQHGQKCDAETAASPKTPVRTYYAYLMRDEEASNAGHG